MLLPPYLSKETDLLRRGCPAGFPHSPESMTSSSPVNCPQRWKISPYTGRVHAVSPLLWKIRTEIQASPLESYERGCRISIRRLWTGSLARTVQRGPCLGSEGSLVFFMSCSGDIGGAEGLAGWDECGTKFLHWRWSRKEEVGLSLMEAATILKRWSEDVEADVDDGEILDVGGKGGVNRRVVQWMWYGTF